MIELRHLRCFVAVAEELSFRRAAERLHVDQSPLSRTIRDLEADLGVLLFARTPRTLRVAPAGEVLLQEAREIFARLESAKRRTRETDHRRKAPLRIGIADGLAQPRMLERLACWRCTVADIPLQVVDLPARDLADALRGERLDVGISFGVPEECAIVQEPAWSHAAAALVPADHELASRSSISLSDLLVHPMFAYHADRQPGLRRQIDRIIAPHAASLIFAGQAGSLTGLMSQVGAGLGVGLMDMGHVQVCRQGPLVVAPLDGDEISITTYLLRKRQRSPLPTALQHFLTHMQSSQ